ncbi:unnamed protein product [Paramecium octaurelia]|uniref:Uncharacterized protein n=1 Tax=Paramecium octaurelia TaxID=43137 RepID=A0A8S1VZZ9_PAROT|nr:unnamed protein product [Paramecium octaurelia]
MIPGWKMEKRPAIQVEGNIHSSDHLRKVRGTPDWTLKQGKLGLIWGFLLVLDHQGKSQQPRVEVEERNEKYGVDQQKTKHADDAYVRQRGGMIYVKEKVQKVVGNSI